MGPGAIALELAALDEENFDVHMTGFEDEDLARLLAQQEAADGLTDEDAVPELAQIQVTVPGDLCGKTPGTVRRFHWRRGVARLLAGEKRFLMVTDWATAYWNDPN
jgi:hypothetical protein